MLKETEGSDAIPSLIQVFENVTGSLVKVTEAENGNAATDSQQIAQMQILSDVYPTRPELHRVYPLSSPQALLLSLQSPAMSLILEIAKVLNTTSVDVAQVDEAMLLAIENTIEAAEQVGLFPVPFFFSPHSLSVTVAFFLLR